MDEDFTIRGRSTRPKKQPGNFNETRAKSQDIRTFFNKEKIVVARVCTEKKSL